MNCSRQRTLFFSFSAKKEVGYPPRSQSWLTFSGPTSFKLRPWSSMLWIFWDEDSIFFCKNEAEALPRTRKLAERVSFSAKI